jgi:hypothetical protein
MSSAFAFHVVCVWYGLKSAPTHLNHSLTTGPIFGVQLSKQDSHGIAGCRLMLKLTNQTIGNSHQIAKQKGLAKDMFVV